MNLVSTPNLLVSMKKEYFKLATLLDNCQSKARSEDILLTANHAKLAYSKEAFNSFITQSLYHYVRSRIAFFQMNFLWFQKETLALINFWLSNEIRMNQYLGQQSEMYFMTILCFGTYDKPTFFPDLFLKVNEEKGHLEISLKQFLNSLKEDKMSFLEMAGKE